MTPNVTGETVSQGDIRQMQGNRSPPPAYIDHFSDMVVPAATELDLFEDPMLSEVNSARSSEQNTSLLAMPPAPRYEQAV